VTAASIWRRGHARDGLSGQHVVFGGKADIINCGVRVTSGSRLLAMKMALVAIIVSLVSTPIWAAEFYIVHDRSTQKCTVVDKPLVTNIRTITLATDAIYKTRREAESAMRAI
jgi:hypothetical protein